MQNNGLFFVIPNIRGFFLNYFLRLGATGFGSGGKISGLSANYANLCELEEGTAALLRRVTRRTTEEGTEKHREKRSGTAALLAEKFTAKGAK